MFDTRDSPDRICEHCEHAIVIEVNLAVRKPARASIKTAWEASGMKLLTWRCCDGRRWLLGARQ